MQENLTIKVMADSVFIKGEFDTVESGILKVVLFALCLINTRHFLIKRLPAQLIVSGFGDVLEIFY